jgi:hypothetical protein
MVWRAGQPQAPAQLADTNSQLAADGKAPEAEAAGNHTGLMHQQQQLQLTLQPPISRLMARGTACSVDGRPATWLPG